jgi:UTP-glucose-1-phosphate uridylyltransferase
MTSNTSPTLLILAAGMGSRYGGLKQIDPVGPHGEAILDYSVYDALRAGFGKVVFVIRRQIEQAFREIVAARFENRVQIDYVFQELDQLPSGFAVPAGRTKPWGTTHALLSASDVIHEPFAVVNADDFYGAEGYRHLAEHLRGSTEDYAMAGFLLRNTLSDFGSVARGVCKVDGNGFLEEIVELTRIERDRSKDSSSGHEGFAQNTDTAGLVTSLTGNEAVSMNMWGFRPAVFDQLRHEFERFLMHHGRDTGSEIYLPNSVNTLIHSGQGSGNASGQVRVKVLPTQGEWLGVTYREDRPHVVEGITRLIREGIYPERLWPERLLP